MLGSGHALRRRWLTPQGRRLREEVLALIGSRNAPRSGFLEVLAGLPHSEDLPDYVDLRGVPFGGALTVPDCTYFDLSFAQEPPEGNKGEVHLCLGMDYQHSRFREIKAGISVLGAKLSYADFSRSVFPQVHFDVSHDLQGTIFEGSSFRGGSFQDQELRRCDFRMADLREVDFLGVSLRGCDFRGAKLKGCAFLGCHFDPDCRLDGATVRSTEGWPGQPSRDPLLGVLPAAEVEAMAVAVDLARQRPEFASIRQLVVQLAQRVGTKEGAEADQLVGSLGTADRAAFELLMEEVRDELNVRAQED